LSYYNNFFWISNKDTHRTHLGSMINDDDDDNDDNDDDK